MSRSCGLLAVVLLAGGMLALAGCAKPELKAENNSMTIDAPPPAVAAPAPDTAKMPTAVEPLPPVQTGPIVLPPPTPPAGGRIHVVAKGDNIYQLAIKYYGRGSKENQQKIMDANPTYKDPTKIPVGAKLLIP